MEYCISHFGQDFGKSIAEGKVKIGMTTEMCKSAWGEPYNINKTTDAKGIYEIWWYFGGLQKFLTFTNGVLVKINE